MVGTKKTATKKTATKKAATKKAATKKAATKKTAAKATATSAPASPFAPDAYGLRFLRQGFAVTPEEDVLFAVGYPHVVLPTDEPMPEVDEDSFGKRFPIDTVRVPRVFLHRLYGAVGAGADDDGVRKALRSAPPKWTPALVAKHVMALFENGSAYELLLLEAMVGSATLAEVATEVLEALPLKEWDGARGRLVTYASDTFGALYFVLLRTPAALHAKLTPRLERLFVKAKKYRGGAPVDGLDVLLHGRAGVERSGYRDAEDDLFQDLIYVHDDPAWVEATALAVLSHLRASDHASFDARLAFVGGPRVLAALRASLARFPSDQRVRMKAQLARLR